jgi:hypothetical protein
MKRLRFAVVSLNVTTNHFTSQYHLANIFDFIVRGVLLSDFLPLVDFVTNILPHWCAKTIGVNINATIVRKHYHTVFIFGRNEIPCTSYHATYIHLRCAWDFLHNLPRRDWLLCFLYCPLTTWQSGQGTLMPLVSPVSVGVFY